MGILDESTSISNFIIITGSVTYLIHKFINKKYGMKFKSNFELIDYLIDVVLEKLLLGTDKALEVTPKWLALKEKIWKRKKVDKIKTIPQTSAIPRSKVEKIEENSDSLIKRVFTKMEDQITDIDKRSGLAISSFQLELNHLVNKLQKVLPNLDYNNGDEEKDESPNVLTDEEKALLAEDDEET